MFLKVLLIYFNLKNQQNTNWKLPVIVVTFWCYSEHSKTYRMNTSKTILTKYLDLFTEIGIRLSNVNCIGDWNRKHIISKTISSRVDVFKNLTEMDIFCFKSAAIIAVYQIFHLIHWFCLEIIENIKLKIVRTPQSMKSSYLG